MDNDTEINRIAEFNKAGETAPQASPQPNQLQLGQTGCSAVRDEDGIIHILNAQGQQLYALKDEHIPFDLQPLLVTLNLWFMAFNNGRSSVQQELRDKALEILKICL